MHQQLSFFNWSLQKALDTEPDSFIKARIRIIYTLLLFTLLKIFVIIGLAAMNDQWLQVVRAVIGLVFYGILAKLVLYKPSRLKVLTHIMLQIGTLVVWTNIFMYAHNVNLITIQFAFMISLISFYTLGTASGIIYSLVGTLPIILFTILHGKVDIYVTEMPQEFASPGFEIVVVLNFISLIVAHYLFYQAIHVNTREKETLNEELRLSIAKANNLAASKSNFLSTMSHELRTPLNSVVGITELLLEDKPEERQKENLKILKYSAHDLLSLVNNILDFNKVDSDKIVLESVSFHLAEFMKNICSVLKIKAQDKNIDFVLDIDEKLWDTYIVSDPTRISQLIYNLAGNAIKFTDKGNVTVRLECTNSTDKEVEVRFSIIDTGIGIHPDKHDTIFELFTQAESHTTRKYGGTGLGLAIVKQVLTLFDSTIELESAPGKGTTFYFTLLLTKTAAIIETENEVVPTTDISHLNILIAEDNEVNRIIIKKQLDRLNIKPTIVENGQLAIDAHLANSYDAIFMDLHMPLVNGHEATQQIRKLADPVKAAITIVAFTASVTEQQEILNSGFDDFLYKPVNMNDLREKLEKISHLRAKGSRSTEPAGFAIKR